MEELLKAMQEFEVRTHDTYTDIRIYADGSGAFYDGNDWHVFDFDTLEEAIKKLKEN